MSRAAAASPMGHSFGGRWVGGRGRKRAARGGGGTTECTEERATRGDSKRSRARSPRGHETSLSDQRGALPPSLPRTSVQRALLVSVPSAVVGRWKQMAWFGYVESSSRRPSGAEAERERERERERGMADIYKACLPNFYLESVSWSQLGMGNGGKGLQYL